MIRGDSTSHWVNKSDNKGKWVSRPVATRSQMEFHSRKHPLTWFQKVVITVNIDSLEHATGYWTNVFTCRRCYKTTISQNVTHISKILKHNIFCPSGSYWWAGHQVTKDLKEKKNRENNKYKLWLSGFTDNDRIVIKARLNMTWVKFELVLQTQKCCLFYANYFLFEFHVLKTVRC